jgi:hypothetical protein
VREGLVTPAGNPAQGSNLRGTYFSQSSPVVVNLLGWDRKKTAMDIPEDPLEHKKWMMEVLQQYGKEFLILEPEDQPNVFAAPEPEYRDLRSGNLDPRELRSWRYLDFTLQLLRERYDLF